MHFKRVQCWNHRGPCKSPWSCNTGFIPSAVAEGNVVKFSNQYTCFTFSALWNKTGTFYNFIHEYACLMMSGWSISPSIYFESFTIMLEMLVKMWAEHLDGDLLRCISFLTFCSFFFIYLFSNLRKLITATYLSVLYCCWLIWGLFFLIIMHIN